MKKWLLEKKWRAIVAGILVVATPLISLALFVTLGLLMPRMSGFEVVDLLRSGAKTASIPIIVLTGMILSSEDKKDWTAGSGASLKKEKSGRINSPPWSGKRLAGNWSKRN